MTQHYSTFEGLTDNDPFCEVKPVLHLELETIAAQPPCSENTPHLRAQQDETHLHCGHSDACVL